MLLDSFCEYVHIALNVWLPSAKELMRNLIKSTCHVDFRLLDKRLKLYVGNVNLKVTPLLEFCSTQIFPLCNSITFLHKARPIPLPPAGVLVLELITKAPNTSKVHLWVFLCPHLLY